MERAMRLELTTPTMARLCSTTELRPRLQLLSYSRVGAIATGFLFLEFQLRTARGGKRPK